MHPQYLGHTVPEYYYMRMEGNNPAFVLTGTVWEGVEDFFTKNRNAKEELDLAIAIITKNKKATFPSTGTECEGYTIAIPYSKKISPERTTMLARSVSSLTSMLSLFQYDFMGEAREAVKRKDVPGELPQLFSLETEYSSERDLHCAPLDLAVSPKALEFLLLHERKVIPGAQENMRKHGKQIYPKSFGFDQRAVIREKGTLGFATIGNCACMGAAPEKRTPGEGYSIDSHNVDAFFQQLNLMVGIATMWSWVRTSLKYT
jgi:hypothetical protein